MITMCLVGAMVASGGAARADAGKPSKTKADKTKSVDCSKTAKRKARAAADKAMKAKDYKAAIATLEPLAHCNDTDQEAIESAWLQGDLAVAYDKNGQYVECKRLVEPLVFPKSDVARQANDKLLGALQYNLDHCQKQFDAQYASIKGDACPLKLDDAVAAASLPAALVPKPAGAGPACVALLPGAASAAKKDDSKQDDDGLAEVVCPQVAVVWKAKGKLERQALAVDAGALGDDFCCGMTRIAVGSKDGKALVRISSPEWVRECHGGTATMSLDTIFEWKGSALSVVSDASNLLW
jgi:hypothetical protein